MWPALFPKAPYAAVGTINAAIVALAKAFSDRGIVDDRVDASNGRGRS
jgi:hypothetical protein